MPFDASVRAYLRAYQNEYRAALHGGQHTAELSFRVPMHEMFRRIAHDLNPAGTFDIILEPRNQGRMGRPDWRIQDRISLGVYGYIEAKGPSNEPFDTTPYRDQINRYLTLGHKLIITDGIDFVFCFTETPVVVSIIDKARMDALDWSRLPVDPLFRFYMEQFFSNPAPQRVDEEKLVELVAIRTRNLADEIREYSDLTIEEAKLIQYFSSNHITGWRRKYNVKGHPDFVFLDKRIAIFVDGCFWHGHDCRNTRPAENAEYWKKKRTRNIEHDKAITNLFERRGWSVIRIWECELKKKNRAILDEKLSIITSLPKKS